MTKQQLPNPRFFKTVFEARYKPKLKFYELNVPAAIKFSEYPHWITDRIKITLCDYAKKCNLTIAHNTFSYAQDLNDNDQQLSYIEKALTQLPDDLEIPSYNRLGFRRQYLTKITMNYSELVTLSYVKLFSQDINLRDILPEKIDDLAFIADCSDGKIKYHIKIGPILKKQIQQYIEFDKVTHLDPLTREKDYLEIIESYPEAAVFFDIDIYRDDENIPPAEGSPFLKEANSRMEKLVKDFRDFLFAQKGV